MAVTINKGSLGLSRCRAWPQLTFESQATWRGPQRAGAGVLTTGQQRVVFSAPESMGGRGVGSSPEELLVSAVASCYSGTLFICWCATGSRPSR
jgi:organic hydroperoxide reductase OsmC/OhrA